MSTPTSYGATASSTANIFNANHENNIAGDGAGGPTEDLPLTTNDTAEQDNNNNNNVVELATLVLPSSAIEDGIEAGGGTLFVLEAEKTTVDNIVDTSGPDARLSAVVDLKVLGDLLDVEIEDLISDLRHDVDDNRVFEDDLAAMEDTVTDTSSDANIRQVDTTPDHHDEDERRSLLQPAAGDTGSLAKSSAKSRSSSASGSEIVYDRVELPADPFIETLAESLAESTQAESILGSTPNNRPILPTIYESNSTSMLSSLGQYSNDNAHLTAVDGQTTKHHDVQETLEIQEAAATKTDDDNHIAHDAFLLNIPNTNDDGEVTDHFVLALPEIRADSDESVASSMSHHSEDYTFPMLQRALSFLSEDLHLPSDIVSIQLEAHIDTATVPHDEATIAGSLQIEPSVVASTIGGVTEIVPPTGELNLDLVVKRQVPVIGYIILIGGLFALASVGAALDLQVGPSAIMKTLWRLIATSLVMSPLVVRSLCIDGLPELTRVQWLMLPCAGAAYAYMCAAFVVALEHTTLANAFVLSNMTSLVIIAGRFILRLPVLKLEGIGASIGFIGAAVCAQAAPSLTSTNDIQYNLDDTNTENESTSAMIGNAIALSASFGTAIYLIFAKSLRPCMDLWVFLFSVMFFGALVLLLYMIVVGEEFVWGFDEDLGLFGWTLWKYDRLLLEMFMAVVCNCMGTTGYIAVLKYFPPVVPASVMLMEPIVGSLLGVLAGTSAIPGIQTWIGDGIVVAGTALVILSGAKKTEKIEATEALRPSANDDASTIVSALKSTKSGPGRQRLLSSDNTTTKSASASAISGTKIVWES